MILCGRGVSRSGVALVIRQRLPSIPDYGLKCLRQGNERTT